jgi:NitT/TauT family transport system permease protein/sulfonate transport system permease protein
MGRVRLIEAIFRPFYEIIRPIPPIAWISLAILWFGLGEMTKYFLIFLSAFANVTYTAMAGARAVDPALIGAARMLGAKHSQLFTTVVLPSATPYIFSGMQVALGTSWATVVAAEMVRSSEGVGWIIVSGMEINNITQILVGIISIGIMGFFLASLLRLLEKALLAWNVGGV